MRSCKKSSSAVWPATTEVSEPTDLDGTVSWRALFDETEQILARSGVTENAGTEARWILEEVLGLSGAEFTRALDGLATERGVAHLDTLVARRSGGEPIQYVLGHWPFRNIDLLVDQRVLIPRPETEIVAGLAIDELDRIRPEGNATVIDLGTGSGAIGLSIAQERPTTRVLLTDVSSEALAVARANLAGLGIVGGGVEIAEGSWFEAVPERFRGECDVIISNPPYIPDSDDLDASVTDWEPQSALFAGDDGRRDLDVIVPSAAGWLRPGGSLVLEMDPRQTKAISEVGRTYGFECSVHADLAGHDRAVVLRKSI